MVLGLYVALLLVVVIACSGFSFLCIGAMVVLISILIN